MAKGSPMGIVTGLDIIKDPLAATLFKSLTSRSQGSLMHEQVSGGTAVALARIPKNVRCHKDSKKNVTPSQEGHISIRTPDQEVGMVHIRAAERLETHRQSLLHKMPKSANALGNIQHSLNPALRPLLKQWARDLHILTSRHIAKQISNHCNQQQIVDSVNQIVRKWALEGPSTFPIALGPIDDESSLFNPTPANGETQDCIDSTSHRLVLGAMSFIVYCDHTVPLNSVCDIFLQLTDQSIKNPETNIRLAWAAVTLGNQLLVGLCRCFEATCTCATQQTGDILNSLKNSQTQIYCRERARNRDQATVLKQFQIDSTCVARQKARKLHPTLIDGELGIITAHCTTHGDLMAKVNFPTHGILEIPAEIAFIHPLEARENCTKTGPRFTLGDKITTLEGPAFSGIVHGFVTQMDSSSLILIWFNETDKYVQLRPDQIQLDDTALPTATPKAPPQGHHNTGQTCLSGCTLLANPSGGIQMREVRPGTFLINAKGKKVRVTNVYFSRESTVMVQISEHWHATITHPILDTKVHGWTQRNRGTSAKTIVTAAQWRTRRRNDTYRFTPMDVSSYQPLGPRVSQYLHSSSPQNLRKSGDMWRFSTENNQPVRSFDDTYS
jgi:hypothetical protein